MQADGSGIGEIFGGAHKNKDAGGQENCGWYSPQSLQISTEGPSHQTRTQSQKKILLHSAYRHNIQLLGH
jgi:hypothetical protein